MTVRTGVCLCGLHVPGWEARATLAGGTPQVLLNSRPGADHSPRLTSLHPLGHHIRQGNKTDGVGRMGGGEGFRAGTPADHAGGVRRRASRVPRSRDCDVQTGQVDAGGSEPVLRAVVSAPDPPPPPRPTPTPSGFGSNSIPPGPRWERARAQRGHGAVAPDRGRGGGGRLDQERPALSRHWVSSPSVGRWRAGGELTPAVRGWGRTRESVQSAHPPWSSPTSRPPAVA